MYWIKSSYHHTPSRPVLLLSAFFVLSWMKERRFKSCCFYHDHAQIINSETTGSDDCSYIFCSIGLTRLLGRAMAAYLKVHATLNFVWSFVIVKCYKPWLQSSKNARVPFYPLHYQYFHILITIWILFYWVQLLTIWAIFHSLLFNWSPEILTLHTVLTIAKIPEN